MNNSIEQPNITVLDYYDGFGIVIGDKRFYFDQEDSRKRLIEMFEALGLKAEYEEVY